MNPDTQQPLPQPPVPAEQPQPMPDQIFIQPQSEVPQAAAPQQPLEQPPVPEQQPALPTPPVPRPVVQPEAQPQQSFEPQPPVPASNPLSSMQPGEQNIFEAHRHPIGVLGVYVSAALIVLLVGICAITAPSLFSNSNLNTVHLVSLLAFLVAAAFAALFVWVARKVYYGNRWILTTDSLTQVRQNGLFDKQNSQLSLANLEDISAVQDGVFQHMFNYGALRVETASERGKFVFTYCPNPNEYARQILDAREKFEQRGSRAE